MKQTKSNQIQLSVERQNEFPIGAYDLVAVVTVLF